MSDLDLLKAAVEGRYVPEREIGRGGMATVYAAEDVLHGRRVALKVMSPEIGSAMGADRFRREIRIIAALQHPHIVPVFDSGEAGDLLWFTMPFIEGESLRARLERERRLPLDETLRIAGQVASALDEAHRRGILHRDIKPENILLTQTGDAMLADFGVARPVLRGSGATLTADGSVVGTPAYMSPEQITGEGLLDARMDVYALGCVVYEMLAGEPPHLGGTVQNVMAKKLTEAPGAVRALRPEVPAAWDAALSRALAATPADRFPSAGAFVAALGAPVARRRRTPLLAAAAAVVVLGGAAALWAARSGRSAGLDRSLLAVLPFRVSSADTALAYLGEGMVDLLAVKFTGEGGPRAVDPRAAVSAWSRQPPVPDAAARAARSLGAGLVLGDGAVVGDARRITISATLTDVGGGRGTPASVSGPPDSIAELADRLATALLAQRAGEQSLSLEGVTTLPALRAYLSGRVNTRRGRYEEALRDFDHALDEDSTFTLAALGIVRLRTRGGSGRHDAAAIAWRGRASLSPVNQALLRAYVGAAYPAPFSLLDNIAELRHVTELAPDNAESWFELGDMLLHFGEVSGIEDALPTAQSAFRRALALDSSYFLPLEHLIRHAIVVRDTAQLSLLMPRLIAADTTADWFTTIRWNAALLRGDSARIREMHGWLDQAVRTGAGCRCSPDLIASYGQVRGAAPDDAVLAARLFLARSPGDAFARLTLASALVNTGHPAEAARYDRPLSGEHREGVLSAGLPLLQQLLNDGDSASGQRARARLDAIARDAGRPPIERELASCFQALAATLAAPSPVRDRAASPVPATDDLGQRDDVIYCRSLVDAAQATARQAGDAKALIMRADSIAIWSLTLIAGPGNFIEAILLARAGDVPGARRIMQREAIQVQDPLYLYAAYLRERGRLALLDHDTVAARDHWGQYLALRAHPEPAIQPAVDSIRNLLRGLN